MPVQPLQIQIKDDDGVEHYYEFAPHPAGLSIRLVNRLQTILLAPLTALIAGSRQTKQGGNLFDRELDPAAGSAFAMTLAKAITEAGEDTYIKQLLAYAHTRRAGDTKLTKCSDHFDFLYTQNLGEMAMVVYHAIQTSWGKSLRRFFKGEPIFQELMSGLKGLADIGGQTKTDSSPSD